MIKLYQFPISHYCEKVRWALEFKNIRYQTINLLPGLHLKATKKLGVRSSVPIIQHEDKIISGSKTIIDYLEDSFRKRSLQFEDKTLNLEIADWENLLDKTAGINVRLVAYHVLLKYPEIVKPFFAHQGPWFSPLYLFFAYEKLSKTMRKLMNINPQSFESAKQTLHELVETLDKHYRTNQFLIGQRFTRADLTAAALFAPLVMPKGYGLNWPTKVPEEYQLLQSEFSEKLTWVEPLYRTYR